MFTVDVKQQYNNNQSIYVLQDEDFLEKATDLLTAELLGQLENSNWKERLAGMEKFTQIVKSMTPSEIPCQICVRAVNKKPGLKETNFQVGVTGFVAPSISRKKDSNNGFGGENFCRVFLLTL